MMGPLKRLLDRLFVSPGLTRVCSAVLGCARVIVPHPASAALAASPRILVIKLDRIGDMILTSPFLRELRRAFPEAWITLVASSSVESLVRNCPYVSEVVCVDSYAEGPRAKWKRFRENVRLAWQCLLQRRYTHAIIPRYGVDHYMAYQTLAFSRARQRIGFTIQVDPVKAAVNAGADCLLTQVLPPLARGHEVERMLSVLTALGHQSKMGPLELWLDSACRERAAQIAARWSGQCLVGVCPSSNEAVRDWPFDRFLELFGSFAHRPDVRFVIFGGTGLGWIERALRQHDLPQVVNLAGQLSLAESAALVGRCDLFLTVDTGLMHCAAAHGVPVVEITSQPVNGNPNHHHSPARFGPWQVPHHIVAPPGADARPAERLIDRVTVAEVAAAMRALLPTLA